VAWRNGTPVRLEQLANVIDSVENNKLIAWMNNVRCVMLGINRQPGRTRWKWVDNHPRLLPAIPAGAFRRRCAWPVVYDGGRNRIRNSIRYVEFTLAADRVHRVLVISCFCATSRPR